MTRADHMTMNEILSIPAQYVNGLYVTPYQGATHTNIRLTFYESHVLGDLQCRAAVIMSLEDLQQIKAAIDMAIASFTPKKDGENKDAVLQ